ncbi:MAG: energy-coupling factor transporter ATPase [Oscillospiraceae bacterium]|nr:energy-coupling factor transporter ATPase [Oscillospiraceae bacterium]
MPPIIETKALCHVYSPGTPFEHAALTNVNFSAERGEFVGIIGHTGSGKSTLMQHLNGLLKPTSGQVLFDGADIWQSKAFLRKIRFRVGLVFQYPEYQLFEETIFKDIAFGPRNMALDETAVEERVCEAADLVGLPRNLLDKSPFDLSGGQKRRVAIAGVIAMRPDVLILDEPTAGLDPLGRERVLQNIRDYQKNAHATVIMVSHSMEEIASTVDRLFVMNHSKEAMAGTPREVFSHADALTKIGLAVPQVTMVLKRLRELGLPVDASAYTVEQACQALLALRGGDKNA